MRPLAAERRHESTSLELIGSSGDGRLGLTASENYGIPDVCSKSLVTGTLSLETRSECEVKWDEYTLAHHLASHSTQPRNRAMTDWAYSDVTSPNV